MKKVKKVKRQMWHTFKRRLPDVDGEKQYARVKCLVKGGTAITTIYLTLAHIERALKEDGQADSQNCGGAFCVRGHKDRFNHPVGYFVDWWRKRVFIEEGNERGAPRCRVYAHYDNVEELFDTDAGLIQLKRKVEKAGVKGYEITLYPVAPGKHPRTGKFTQSSGRPGTSGDHRRVIGGELRFINALRGRLRDFAVLSTSAS